jgi:hypothetical protein
MNTKIVKGRKVNSALTQLREMIDGNLHWVSYIKNDYDNGTADCECEDICRCSTIANARVTAFYPDKFVEALERVVKDPMNLYCIERVMTHSKMADFSQYDFRTRSGYYGEELEGIYFKGESPMPVLEEILSTADYLKKILAALKFEYGHLLPHLERAKKATLCTVVPAFINQGAREHLRRLDRDCIRRYSERKSSLPQVVLYDGGGIFSLIDDYHRLSAIPQGKEVFAVIIKGA